MKEDWVLGFFPFMALLLPLGGFIVLALFGDWIRRDKEEKGAGILACVTVVLSFAISVWCAARFIPHHREHLTSIEQHRERLENLGVTEESLQQALEGIEGPLFFLPVARVGEEGVDFIRVAGLRVPLALLVDPLSVVMMLVVSGVGSVIHIYSLGYMAHDEDRVRYFSYLNLFTFFMLLLVLGRSLPLVFVGWEGVGLCSYLLIGFWFKKRSASDAGKKAFIVNRIGDAGLILGMIMAFGAFGTLDLVEITSGIVSKPAEALGEFGIITAVALLLFLGACGKSAQIPLHVWLPDAMEGPTPVSALIHAATMVTAGVYMVARLAPLYARSETAMTVVAVIGAATAFMAATVALVQTDIKRVLAYSTVSQLGYMFLACGVGAFGFAIFHLFTHAFFKALLFLGSGSVIHALSGEQDLRRMGGLRGRIPWTCWTFVVGTAAIAGVPFLAGYFSKDGILVSALLAGKTGLFAVGLVTAVLTAFYMSRLLFLTFWGEFRGEAETEHLIHESPWTMLIPLCLLALGSAAAGYVDVPGFLALVFRQPFEHPHAPEWLHLLAYLLPFLGIVPAYYLYVHYPEVRQRLFASLQPVKRVLEAKYGFDDAYNWFARRAVVDGSTALLWKRVDAGVIDGAVNGTGSLMEAFARAARTVQTGLVRGYALVILGGAVALLSYLLWMR